MWKKPICGEGSGLYSNFGESAPFPKVSVEGLCLRALRDLMLRDTSPVRRLRSGRFLSTDSLPFPLARDSMPKPRPYSRPFPPALLYTSLSATRSRRFSNSGLGPKGATLSKKSR